MAFAAMIKEAFASLVDATRTLVCSIALAILRDVEASRDVAQESSSPPGGIWASCGTRIPEPKGTVRNASRTVGTARGTVRPGIPTVRGATGTVRPAIPTAREAG